MTVPCLVHEALEHPSVLHQAMERSIAYIFHAVLHLTTGFQDHRQPHCSTTSSLEPLEVHLNSFSQLPGITRV